MDDVREAQAIRQLLGSVQKAVAPYRSAKRILAELAELASHGNSSLSYNEVVGRALVETWLRRFFESPTGTFIPRPHAPPHRCELLASSLTVAACAPPVTHASARRAWVLAA